MFGIGKKARKLETFDLLIVKAPEGKNRSFYQVAFPSVVANDVISMLGKLEKSPYNRPEYLGELGGFRAVTHVEGLTGFEVLDEADLEAQPVHIQDFANILLLRLEALQESGAVEESEELAFFLGELTMLRDGSFVPRT